jgi:hypothetical protein
MDPPRPNGAKIAGMSRFARAVRQAQSPPLPVRPLLRKCSACRSEGSASTEAGARFDFGHLDMVPPRAQPLVVGAAGDHFEQEADRVADAVMARGPVPATAASPARVQREGGAGAPTVAPAIVHDVLATPGHGLDASTRASLEPRFGHDLGHVRVHTDDRAARSARSVDALAYTVGRDIVFGPGQYRPDTRQGQRLVAHELAHVAQQGGADAMLQRATDDELASNDTPAEDEEDEAEDGDTPTEGDERSEDGPVDLGEAPQTLDDKPKVKPKDDKPKAPDRTITEVDVDLSGQTLVINWSDGTTSKPITVSTGKGKPNTKDDPCKDPSVDGSNCTPPGSYTIGFLGTKDHKNNKGDRMAWYAEFIGGRSIGIHDSQPVTGTPKSHGCVRIDLASAELINKHVVKGKTKVVVTGTAPTKPYKKAAPAKPKPKAKGK